MMKICMVTPMLYPPHCAAIGIVPKLIGDYLESMGNEVYYITFLPPAELLVPNLKKIIYIKPFFRNKFLVRLKIPLIKTIFSAILKTFLVIKNVDVVHLHSYTPLFYSTLFLSKLFKKPIIITMYGEILDYPLAKIKPRGIFSLSLHHLLDFVVFYSYGLMDFAHKIGIKPKNCSVIYPPIADEFFTKQNYVPPFNLNSANIIITVKSLYPLAATKDLIQAMSIVCKEYPDATLLICGDGPLKNKLIQLASKLKIRENIKFLGWVKNQDLIKYYHSAKVFVTTSQEESLGNSIIEALACKVPVIATSTLGARELKNIFPENITLVEKGNYIQIANQIISFLNKKVNVSDKTVSLIKEKFNVKNVSSNYLQIYENLLLKK